jgi:hypothetical protein
MKMKPVLTTLLIGMLCQLPLGFGIARAADAPPGSTMDVIQKKIQAEVAARFAETGATCDELQVAVAAKTESATPFKVTYRGLRNFRSSSGALAEADGEFIMNYIGGGQWQGKLAGTQLTAKVGTKDNINLPFANDPQVLGEWESVDFVQDIGQFDPLKRAWNGKLFLKGLTFQENGKMPQPWWTWTKGFVLHHGDQTASRYEIRTLNGQPYLFFEWKSGDVTIAGMKPFYYVLKLKAPKTI